MKECEECKTMSHHLNVPNGSRDIPSQSHEFEQNGCRHFVGFQPHFHINMASETQSVKIMKI